MITDQNNMLGTLQNRYQSLRLRRLCRLIDEDLFKLEISESPIECRDTCRTNNISVLKNLVFSLLFKIFKLLVLLFIKFTLLFLQFKQLLHLYELAFV